MDSLFSELFGLPVPDPPQEEELTGDRALTKVAWFPGRKQQSPQSVQGIGTYLGPALDEEPDHDEDLGEEEEEEDYSGPPAPLQKGFWDFVPKRVSLEDRFASQDNASVGRLYRETQDPAALESLMYRYDRQIENAVRGLSKLRIPYGTVRGETYSAFAEAARTWDPDEADLSTHFGARLQNKRRWLVQYSQFSKGGRERVPKMQKIRAFQSDFEDMHGREATAQEIADELKLSKKTVNLILKEDARDLLSSRDMGSDRFMDPEIKLRRALERVRDSLSTTNQKVLDHLYGLNGKEASQSNKEIAKAVGVSPTHVSTQRGVISSLLRDEMQRMGW